MKQWKGGITNIILFLKNIEHQLTLNFSQKCNTIQLAQTMLVPKFVQTQEKIITLNKPKTGEKKSNKTKS